MNYVIFDLEFNQGYKYKRKNKSRVNTKCRFEIIQIGALKLDKDLKTIDTLDRLVRPKVYDHLHHFIAEMTSITEEKLKYAKSFNKVYEEFINFVGDDSILCTWGVSDMRELVRNIHFHKLDATSLPKEYIDIQRIASTYLKTPNGNSVGLKNAVKALELPLESQFHDAFNDAFYTAEVFKKIHTGDILPITYNINENKTDSNSDFNNEIVRINYEKLLLQFEKMFGREMTSEEKKIIKLAYNMGRTGQFQLR